MKEKIYLYCCVDDDNTIRVFLARGETVVSTRPTFRPSPLVPIGVEILTST